MPTSRSSSSTSVSSKASSSSRGSSKSSGDEHDVSAGAACVCSRCRKQAKSSGAYPSWESGKSGSYITDEDLLEDLEALSVNDKGSDDCIAPGYHRLDKSRSKAAPAKKSSKTSRK